MRQRKSLSTNNSPTFYTSATPTTNSHIFLSKCPGHQTATIPFFVYDTKTKKDFPFYFQHNQSIYTESTDYYNLKHHVRPRHWSCMLCNTARMHLSFLPLQGNTTSKGTYPPKASLNITRVIRSKITYCVITVLTFLNFFFSYYFPSNLLR